MKRLSKKGLTIQIALLQGSYWMIFCPIASFASVYLLSKDFSNQSIGWVMAVSNILAVVLQPALGALIDKFERFSLKLVLSCMSVLCLFMLTALILINHNLLLISILYVGIISLLVSMQPLVNSLTFEYINAGFDINYGATRATGSITFAILSTLLGIWLKSMSTIILPGISLVLFAVFLAIVLSSPKIKRLSGEQPEVNQSEEQQINVPDKGFLLRYDRFAILLMGVAFLFLFHTVINTYLAQIFTSLDGQNSDFGISLTIAAICELPAFLGFNFLISRFSTQTLLKFSSISYFFRSLVFAFAVSIWMVNLGQALQGISFAIFSPAAVYYVNKIMRSNDKVKGQTFITGAITLGSVFGSVIGGWLLDKYGVTAMLLFAAAGAALGALLVVISVQKKNSTNKIPSVSLT